MRKYIYGVVGSSIVCEVNVTRQYFFFLYKYYKRLKRKIKTPQLAFIKTNQLKYTKNTLK